MVLRVRACSMTFWSLLLQIGLGNVSLILPFGILWEPSLSDALPLFEKFQDTPEAGAADYAEDRAQDSVLHQKAGSYEKCAGKGKYPPALGSEIIFALDYYGVKEPYDQKGRHRYYQSSKIHKSCIVVGRKEIPIYL